MTIKFNNELLLITISVILLIVIITWFQSSVLRIIVGLPFLLFLPGYTLIAALFPKRSALGIIERVALSFGLSILVVPFIGFILNYTMWGITLNSIIIILTIFVLASSIIAWIRRRRLFDEERFVISFTLSLRPWMGWGNVDKLLSVILAAVLLGTIGIIGHVASTPGEKEKFTEFYLLGPDGKAEGYPEELTVGEIAKVMVGIVNLEYEEVSYELEITIGGNKYGDMIQVALGSEEKWEREVFFTPVVAGEKQKVEFVLYNDGESYRRLHLWIDVTAQD